MTLRAVLRLARIPNCFTAFGNVIAGIFLARAGRLTPGTCCWWPPRGLFTRVGWS